MQVIEEEKKSMWAGEEWLEHVVNRGRLTNHLRMTARSTAEARLFASSALTMQRSRHRHDVSHSINVWSLLKRRRKLEMYTPVRTINGLRSFWKEILFSMSTNESLQLFCSVIYLVVCYEEVIEKQAFHCLIHFGI